MKRRSDGRYQKYITMPDGKPKILYSSAANERLAVKDFNEQIMNIKKKQTESVLFSSVAEKWEEARFHKMENNTLKGYRSGLKTAVEYFGNIDVREIKPTDIQKFVDDLEKKKLSPKTIKNKFSVLSLILKYAIFLGEIELDPSSTVAKPKVGKKQKRDQASEVDQEKIFASVDKPFGVFALFLLTTGCRRGEALALTPKDIDTKKKLVKITKTVEWIGQKPQIKQCPKTDAGIREIPIHEKMIEYLMPLMNQKYLFHSKSGDLFPESQFERAWNRYKKESGVDCTPHQLRHSYATILFDAGIDVKTAQRWLGHADIKTTLEIYTHLSESRIDKSIESITSFVGDKFAENTTVNSQFIVKQSKNH